MFERLAVAENGSPTVLAGKRMLHSRYDPEGEAERYINTLKLPRNIRFFILIEPGLGYVIPVIQRQFPAAKILALHASDFFIKPPVPLERNWSAWSPGTGKSLQEFLEGEIPDTAAAAVRILEWRPAMTAYGEAYLGLLQKTVEFVKLIDANARTVGGFGRRWFRNCLRNMGIMRRIIKWPPGGSRQETPWIITGAGPGLEDAIPLIKMLRERYGARLLAVSSSAAALAAAGLRPDMLMSADGGGWALFHLYEAFRTTVPCPALAASLWAALPSQYGDIPILPVCDGSLWQRIILEAAGLSAAGAIAGTAPYAVFPQRGTVTAAALDLALALTGGPVFFAGMDLAHRDIRTHARPYGLDRFQEERSGRFNPRYSQAFIRAGLIASSGSHGIYAAWFKRQLGAYPGRLFSLGENNPVFDSLKTDIAQAGSLLGRDFLQAEIFPLPSDVVTLAGRREKRPGLAVQGLIRALERPETAGPLCKELGPLLLPGEKVPDAAALAAEIRALAKSYEEGVYG